ncbi:hypothetical protein HPP92_027704 [Vanilla planifolia]|uniref:Uncharacterized protein n=1 Tax=Vanilla planifolia TaxID=51239 RepID=A0A835PA69_VANPL|nr:hypothetical protein HPP92_027704 [Vanilla planifolia]
MASHNLARPFGTTELSQLREGEDTREMDEEIQKAKKLIVIQVGISVTRQNEQDGLDKRHRSKNWPRMALTILIPPDSIIAVAREVM